MECPKCGYMMDEFTRDCPRCAQTEAHIPVQPQIVRSAPSSQRTVQPSVTLRANSRSSSPAPVHAPSNKRPVVLVASILILALIACGIIIIPGYLKQRQGGGVGTKPFSVDSHIEHINCNGIKFTVELPADWGTEQTSYKNLPIRAFTPNNAPANPISSGIFGASAKLNPSTSTEEITHNILIADNGDRILSEDNMETDSGLSMVPPQELQTLVLSQQLVVY